MTGEVYAYGYLKGIRFTRTETLGIGGNKCDFYKVISKDYDSDRKEISERV